MTKHARDLTMHRDARAEILSQLERSTRRRLEDFGNGKHMEWRSKIGLPAGVTSVIGCLSVRTAPLEKRPPDQPCGWSRTPTTRRRWRPSPWRARGWGRDGLGTGARGRGARARRALMSTTRMFGRTTSGGGTWSCGRSAARLAAARDRCSYPRGRRSAPAPRGNRLCPVRCQRDGARGDLRSAASRARAHLPSVCTPELLEQGSPIDQVGRVESLREPRVDFRDQRVGLGRLALARP